MESTEYLGSYRLTQSDDCFKLGRDSVLLSWAAAWDPSCSCCPSGRRT